ncbi:MAG: hypothetical protein GXP28_03015 [Planctomycetes bacterium]|nr:hypothetical protein [Planctomycetota bacterium]
MSTEVFHSRQQRLREAAILVASLDDQLAERLVTSMPTADAEAVRMALKQLGAIDPDERDEIVARFRQSAETKNTGAQSTSIQHPTQVDGVELDASLLARFEEQDLRAADPVVAEESIAESLPDTLSKEEAATVVSMLSVEHPQTISIVLSRLNPSIAADLLSQFSPRVGAEVLTRMANCDSVDEQAVRVIESQLGQWIDQHRQQRQRMAVGLGLVERILSSTPETQRQTVLTQLRSSNPDLAGRLTKKPNPLPSPAPVPRASRLVPEPELPKQVKQNIPLQKPLPSANPQQELDQLDDATLMATLSQADRQVVMLALAGASETLMKRILRGLPRRQATKLRSQLRDIGPTRLSDILAAQQQLLQSANQRTTNN